MFGEVDNNSTDGDCDLHYRQNAILPAILHCHSALPFCTLVSRSPPQHRWCAGRTSKVDHIHSEHTTKLKLKIARRYYAYADVDE